MSTLACCIVAQSPMRSEPSDKSEMVSQMLFGESCTILLQKESWLHIASTHDGYEGWVDAKHFLVHVDSAPLAPIAAASIWKDEQSYVHRLSPGALVAADCTTFSIQGKTFEPLHIDPLPKDILSFAQQFLGTPYLWGGRSLFGIDCSGYTQQIARFAGISLPRDAYQQAEHGEHITFIEESRTGDFAFFDNAEGRIIHVGMIVHTAKDIRILHASGMVRSDLLDHQGIFRQPDNTYTHNLRFIKRIL